MPEQSNVNDEMTNLAKFAVSAAKEKFGQVLDFSEKTLPALDSLLDQAYSRFSDLAKQGKLRDESVRYTAKVWGTYLGEVIRRKIGGQWFQKQSDFVIMLDDHEVDPVQYVYRCITRGSDHKAIQYYAEISSRNSPPAQKLVSNRRPTRSKDAAMSPEMEEFLLSPEVESLLSNPAVKRLLANTKAYKQFEEQTLTMIQSTESVIDASREIMRDFPQIETWLPSLRKMAEALRKYPKVSVFAEQFPAFVKQLEGPTQEVAIVGEAIAQTMPSSARLPMMEYVTNCRTLLNTYHST